jgi:hypothetical protein
MMTSSTTTIRSFKYKYSQSIIKILSHYLSINFPKIKPNKTFVINKDEFP